MNEPSNTLALRNYRTWLLCEARREADADCSRLRSIKSELAIYFGDLTRAWSADAKYHLMAACVKRHLFRPTLAPEPLTEDEQASFSQFAWPTVYGTPGLNELYERRIRGEIKLDKPQLKRALRSSLGPICGKRREGSGLGFALTLPTMTVRTEFYFSGPGFMQLRYWHTVAELGLTRFTLFDLLGYPETFWSAILTSEIDETVAFVAQQCTYMISALPDALSVPVNFTGHGEPPVSG
jgi:hypothetical protein